MQENYKNKLLIIDDQKLVHHKIIHVLNKNIDLEISSAYDAKTGIDILNKEHFDLILMDVYMPEMTGFEATKIIRKADQSKDIPIIFITAQEKDEELMDFALKMGGIDFLHKSFSDLELVRLIKLYLRFIQREKDINIELIKANESKDRFFSIIAHDLKSPFNGFLGFLNILKSDLMQMSIEEIIETISDIHDSAHNLFELLENLLDWSRMQRGQMPFTQVPFAINFLVKNTFSLAKLNAENKKISLNNSISDNLLVNADVTMIKTILRNLIMNSIKFVPDGGSVLVSANDTTNEMVSISVIDNGVGMSKEAMEKIFKIDESYSTPGTNDELGTGLGIVLCDELVRKHGGILSVESEIGKGTKFSFTLPKAKPLEKQESELKAEDFDFPVANL